MHVWVGQRYVYLCQIFGTKFQGMSSTAKGFSVKDSMTNDSYFNISKMKLSITSLYIISDAEYHIIWTENSNVIDSFISEILKYESSDIVSSTEKPWGRTIQTTTKNSRKSSFVL